MESCLQHAEGNTCLLRILYYHSRARDDRRHRKTKKFSGPQAQKARDIDSGKKELQKGEMSETGFAKRGKKPDGSFLNLP